MKGSLTRKIINIVYSILQISLIAAFIPKKEYLNSVFEAVIFILYMFFLVYEHKKGIFITNFTRISVIISLLANSFLGVYLRLYTTSFYFDKLLHIFGTFSFTIFAFFIAEKKGYFTGITNFMTFIFILLSGSFLGTVFEIGEYIFDLVFKTVNQGGVADNNIDLMCNILGAALAGLFVVYPKSRDISRSEWDK